MLFIRLIVLYIKHKNTDRLKIKRLKNTFCADINLKKPNVPTY